MSKKLTLVCLLIFSSILLNAQSPEHNSCGTRAPSQQWDEWFNTKVEEYKQSLLTGKAQVVTKIIPVIVHVIHYNQTAGTYPNVTAAQVASQIQVLNDDFGGVGAGVAGVPPHFANLVANTGIKFCLATISNTGGVLAEPGVDRVNALANGWIDPGTATVNLEQYLKNTIIPATIWDPTKYYNIWISDKPATVTINGFATYPSGSGLNGLIGGSFGSPTNDGIWVYAKNFGTTGTIVGPNDKGRVATHETGHWLGLRHIWGDGNCLSDYCGDTPPTKQEHTGCVVTTPSNACGGNQSPQGEMPMNFMDGCDDLCKYMFTNDQSIRMLTALNQGLNRYTLGTHALCTPTPAPANTSSAVASFTTSPTQCLGTPFTPFNTSTGYPYPTFIWSAAPAALFSPVNNVANPAITINNPGSYTITLVATNSLSSSTFTFLVNATNTCTPFNICLDTIKMMRNIDTLKNYQAPSNANILACQSGFRGYLAGTNCYNDKAFAQYFPFSSYTSTPFPQVNSVIVLFNKIGTKSAGGSNITCRLYGGNNVSGPGASIGTPTNYNLNQIVNTPTVTTIGYLAKPNFTINSGIIPFKFDFNQPIIPNNLSGFFIGLEPSLAPGDSINIFTNNYNNPSVDSSAWYLESPNLVWRTFRQNRNAKIQMAIMPQITCSPVLGLKEEKNSFKANVNVIPNPNNGVFSLVFTLPKEEDLTVTLYNTIGQKVFTNTLKQVGNSVMDIDLSQEANGVYFMEVSNGNDRTIKKLIISK